MIMMEGYKDVERIMMERGKDIESIMMESGMDLERIVMERIQIQYPFRRMVPENLDYLEISVFPDHWGFPESADVFISFSKYSKIAKNAKQQTLSLYQHMQDCINQQAQIRYIYPSHDAWNTIIIVCIDVESR